MATLARVFRSGDKVPSLARFSRPEQRPKGANNGGVRGTSHFGAELPQEVAHRVLDGAAVLDEELGVELGVVEAHLGKVTQPGLILRYRA